MLKFIKFVNINSNLLRNAIIKDNKIIGNIDLSILKNEPIVTEMFIQNKYRKKGYGTLLLNDTEKELSNIGADKIQINLWSIDRCYFNNYSFYEKRGYILNLNNNYNFIDNGENIFYNLNMLKNL